MNKKNEEKAKEHFLLQEMNIDKDELKTLKKKLSKIEPRAERGAETLFRLVSKNHYTLNVMVDKKSSILISVNSIILSIIIGTVLHQLDTDPHLIFPAITILVSNLISITYAILATRPEMEHGEKETKNLMFFGNYFNMNEEEYTNELVDLIYRGDDLYYSIAKDTYHLGKSINRKFKMLRHSFHVFLVGIIVSVLGFVLCHLLFI
ncbi:Pycsar system effector family protein [Flagellimonas sp. 2504JD4-2]